MKAQPNAHGVTWATSRTGRISIAVGPDEPGGVRVWAIYAGTHDVAPGARTFTGTSRIQDARDYANTLWRTR